MGSITRTRSPAKCLAGQDNKVEEKKRTYINNRTPRCKIRNGKDMQRDIKEIEQERKNTGGIKRKMKLTIS